MVMINRRTVVTRGAVMLGAQPAATRFPYPQRPQQGAIGPASQGQITRARFLVIGPAGGWFEYTGTPARGNYPVAYSTQQAADPYGNPLPATGTVAYSEATGTYVQLGAGEINLQGPGSYSPGVINAGLALLGFESPLGSISDTAASMRLLSAAASGPALQMINGPVVATHPGGSAPETPQAMTLLNGWVNASGFAAAKYWYAASPQNCVFFTGVISGTAASSAIFFTLPADYAPDNEQGYGIGATGSVPSGAAPNLRCDTSGNLYIDNAGSFPLAQSYFINGYISLIV